MGQSVGTGIDWSDAKYRELKRQLAPSQDELRYQGIPWRATLWSAVREANQDDRPILLWAMNGHPLGCT